MMKVVASLLMLVICLSAVCEASPASSLLNRDLAPPPVRRIGEIQHAAASASLLAVNTNAHATSTLDERIAAETALAVDASVIEHADVEDTVTAAGELDATEQQLVDRFIPIPKTYIPSDPPKPLEYTAPPTRDELSTNLGPRGYPWPEKLQNALTTVESVAKQKIFQIKRQMGWSNKANKLVSELSMKKRKVVAHVASLTKQIKELLGKKKQIQNKQLQDKLVERLEKTHANLKKVRRQTHNIRKNQADMIHHKEELAHALEGIKRSLAILKGMKRQRQFPSRGAGAKLKDELSKFDPDMSFEKEADEVRQLQFPDAVLVEEQAEAEADQKLEAELDQE